MKILFITAEGFDTPNPNNQMAETMIRTFLENDFQVHLIQSHRKGINPDIPDSLMGRKGFTCDTVPRKVVDKTNFIRRYLNDMRYAFQARKRWKKVKDADVIYLQSNPTIVFPMVLLKIFRRRVPIVYSIYDVFPGHAYDIGVIRSKFIYNTLRLIQKPCYRMADKILVQSEDMVQKVVEQGARREKLVVVPAWFDVSTTHEIPWEENRFVEKYQITKDKFHVQFAGTIGYVFDYKAVLELAERLKDEKNIDIQIIGDGNVKEQFMKEAEDRGLSNLIFYPLQPVEIVPDVYSECDACIIPLKKGVIGYGVPSKAAILMACKRVIISSVEKDSAYAKMFEQKDMGIAVDCQDYDGFADAIRFLAANPKRVREMVENAYIFGQENYLSTRNIGVMMDVFRSAHQERS